MASPSLSRDWDKHHTEGFSTLSPCHFNSDCHFVINCHIILCFPTITSISRVFISSGAALCCSYPVGPDPSPTNAACPSSYDFPKLLLGSQGGTPTLIPSCSPMSAFCLSIRKKSPGHLSPSPEILASNHTQCVHRTSQSAPSILSVLSPETWIPQGKTHGGRSLALPLSKSLTLGKAFRRAPQFPQL